MKKDDLTEAPRYRSELRRSHVGMTRERIARAAAELMEQGADAVTFKAVAERAGVTEMTVYRHFPNRPALLKGLWDHLNARMGPGVGMPDSVEALLEQHDALFTGFDTLAPQILASITSPQGREMRASLNAPRREAFIGMVKALAPDLPAERTTAAAAVLQLLHSAYAWDSLRQQWDLDGRAAGEATRWAIEILADHLRRAS